MARDGKEVGRTGAKQCGSSGGTHVELLSEAVRGLPLRFEPQRRRSLLLVHLPLVPLERRRGPLDFRQLRGRPEELPLVELKLRLGSLRE